MQEAPSKGSRCLANPLFENIFAESCKIVNPKLFQLHGLSYRRPSTSSRLPACSLARSFSLFFTLISLSLSALCKRKYSIRTLNSITAFLINPKYLLPKEGRPSFLLPRVPSFGRAGSLSAQSVLELNNCCEGCSTIKTRASRFRRDRYPIVSVLELVRPTIAGSEIFKKINDIVDAMSRYFVIIKSNKQRLKCEDR